MNKLTAKEALTGWVNKAIEGGWLSDRVREYEIESIYQEGNRSLEILKWMISLNFNKYPVSTGINVKGFNWYSRRVTFSINDLIGNAPFMRAVYGSEMVCSYSGNYKVLDCIYMQEDEETQRLHCIYPSKTKLPFTKIQGLCVERNHYIPAHHYHQQQLIILTDDERIEYIKKGL